MPRRTRHIATQAATEVATWAALAGLVVSVAAFAWFVLIR